MYMYIHTYTSQVPSNEACRTALANFFSAVLARQHVPPKEPEFVQMLEARGSDPAKVKEVANMAAMIKELRAKNKKNFPGAAEVALEGLKVELFFLFQATGGQWMINKVRNSLTTEQRDVI